MTFAYVTFHAKVVKYKTNLMGDCAIHHTNSDSYVSLF